MTTEQIKEGLNLICTHLASFGKIELGTDHSALLMYIARQMGAFDKPGDVVWHRDMKRATKDDITP